MSQQIDLDQLSDPTDAMRAVVSQLEAGYLVAVPDETGMLLLALPQHEGASAKLHQILEQHEQAIPVVGLAHRSVLEDYTEALSDLAIKLTRRCWPGPVAMRTRSGTSDGLCESWSTSAQRWALDEFGRTFLVPALPFTCNLLGQLSSPVLGLALRMEDFAALETSAIALTIVSGEARYAEGLTVVRIDESKCHPERIGVVSERVLTRLTGEVYVFICTGNTCRSPMAEAIFRKMLAEKLTCPDDELLDRGYTVISAGLAAYPGSPASREAVKLLKEEGIDLSSHESQPVTEELLLRCDHILTMTQNHLDAILNSLPELAGKAQLLSKSGKDISDPIGAGIEEYANCRDEIKGYLRTLLDQQTST